MGDGVLLLRSVFNANANGQLVNWERVMSTAWSSGVSHLE